MKRFVPFSVLFFAVSIALAGNLAPEMIGQELHDSIKVRKVLVKGNVYMLDCVNGFAGGNVAASIGGDGILLVDDMYASMGKQLVDTVSKLATRPVRIVLNTHFHGDHIQGNINFRSSAVIIGHDNLYKRMKINDKAGEANFGLAPMVTFTDSLKIDFNGEQIRLYHYPNAHTDSDAIVYFTGSKVLHLGDMFFFEMFPAVYAKGGGNIKQLVKALEHIIEKFPADTHVIPGHGKLATMKDLSGYLTMLKQTIAIVEGEIRLGRSLQQMQQGKVLEKYDWLGEGGAQTTAQYLEMLYVLLKI